MSFAAEPPQDELPYGRWADRLRVEFLAACLRIDDEGEDLGQAGDVDWYPDRTWGGRTYVPATARTSTGYELYGYVSFTPGHDGGEPTELDAHAEFTAEVAEHNPDWRLDLCEDVIGTWRGERGKAAQVTRTKGRSSRLDCTWMARAMTSCSLPGSASMSTGDPVSDTSWMRRATSRISSLSLESSP